ncbi:NADH-quinone oxidoreductase subunit K [Phycisphaerales bacterium AB-hyl4]|uniref:NADH-quinone oxidoreductase subunit K n=1 Tax=Natronomicrosphaera hydrolytica TaxID=3242702 RepID=A0ABV4U7U1_9BACT
MMDQATIYAMAAVIVFCFALWGLISYAHLIRKIMALNIMGSAVFLFFGAMTRRGEPETTDPVPQAMVITGIVVAVAATAFAISLAKAIHRRTGQLRLPEERDA